MKKRPTKENVDPPEETEREDNEEDEEEEEIEDEILSSHSILTQVDLLQDSGEEQEIPTKCMKTMKKK